MPFLKAYFILKGDKIPLFLLACARSTLKDLENKTMLNASNVRRYFVAVAVIILVLSTLIWLYGQSIIDLVWQWDNREEYSHGYLIPPVVVYFILQRRNRLQQANFNPAWLGLFCVLLGALLYIVGAASVLFVLLQYSLVLVIIGSCWAFMGGQALKIIIMPLLMLFFAIPLPEYLDVLLSSKLQLISSSLGVSFIRWCKIPVYQDGNLIDLGVYKLQVIEACSGLRYLFPLLSIGFICAYMYQAVLWKRILIFVSCVPLTILMNSFRIGMIGILVDKWGIEMAEGFLHDFEGWIIYMACLGLLMMEMLLLNSLTYPRKTFAETFTAADVDTAASLKLKPNSTLSASIFNGPTSGSAFIMFGLILFTFLRTQEREIIPQRQTFKEFPMQFADWQGNRSIMPSDQLKILKPTDYVLSNYYRGQNRQPINFYVAYYESQKRRAAPHSPRVCIPGGGWEITDISRVLVDGNTVNRLVIKKGLQKQLVYYWYQQRGQFVANELAMKWHLFKDALLLNRTDGALVRLTTPINETEQLAEQQLYEFFKDVAPLLGSYIPK